jgi:hypothetical protein
MRFFPQVDVQQAPIHNWIFFIQTSVVRSNNPAATATDLTFDMNESHEPFKHRL